MEDFNKTLRSDEAEDCYNDYTEKAYNKKTSKHSIFHCSWFSLLDFIIYIFLLISYFVMAALDFFKKKDKR